MRGSLCGKRTLHNRAFSLLVLAQKPINAKKNPIAFGFFFINSIGIISIIIRAYFKIALRMSANGANVGCLSADYYVSAVAAFPYLNFTLFKNCRSFNVVKQCAVPFLMVFFDCTYHTEFSGKLFEPFLFGCLDRKSVV